MFRRISRDSFRLYILFVLSTLALPLKGLPEWDSRGRSRSLVLKFFFFNSLRYLSKVLTRRASSVERLGVYVASIIVNMDGNVLYRERVTA